MSLGFGEIIILFLALCVAVSIVLGTILIVRKFFRLAEDK